MDSDHLEIHRFEMDGESVLIDQDGGVTHKVFIGNSDVTEHVRHLKIDRKTNRLIFDSGPMLDSRKPSV